MGSSSSREKRSSFSSHFLEKPNTQVSITSSVRGGLLYATAAMQGWRAAMEDYHVTQTEICPGHSLFAVLDGHAGKDVAKFASEQLPEFIRKHMMDLPTSATKKEVSLAIKTAFFELDVTITEKFGFLSPGGTTCSGVIINDEWYHVFNVGDSRTVVCADGAMSFATRDHKPSDIGEFTRIQSAGGYVARGRINGQLAVSRALGDNNYKLKRGGHPRSQMVSCEPTCTSIARSTNDDFLMIACDGIWDVMSSEEAISWVQTTLGDEMGAQPQRRRRQSASSKSKRPPHAVTALEDTCTKLIGACLSKGSADNMSVMVIIPIDTTPPNTPTSSPPTPMSSAETVAMIAQGTTNSALEDGIVIARSILSPDRPRLQRALTLAGGQILPPPVRGSRAGIAAADRSRFQRSLPALPGRHMAMRDSGIEITA